jgi:hypothetical protein
MASHESRSEDGLDRTPLRVRSASQESEVEHTNAVLHALFWHVASHLNQRIDDFREQLERERQLLAVLAEAIGENLEQEPVELDDHLGASAWENVARSVCLALIDTLMLSRGTWHELEASQWAMSTIQRLESQHWSELHEDTGLDRAELDLSIRIGADAATRFDWFVAGEKLRSSRGELLIQTSADERQVSWFFTSRHIYGLLLTTGSDASRLEPGPGVTTIVDNAVALHAPGASAGMEVTRDLTLRPSTAISSRSCRAQVRATSDLIVHWNAGIVAHPMPDGLVLEGDLTSEDLVAAFSGRELTVEFGVAEDGARHR